MPSLYLASLSPRRSELLKQIGVSFRVLACSIDESVRPAEQAALYVERLARAKAQAGLALLTADADACVLGADTSVVLDGRILGKPANRQESLQMLQALSAREHQVLTAVALATRDGCQARLVTSQVGFRTISAAEMQNYWDTGEPADKAGAYGIQGYGSVLVDRIEGCFFNVMGLPLARTVEQLRKLAGAGGVEP